MILGIVREGRGSIENQGSVQVLYGPVCTISC